MRVPLYHVKFLLKQLTFLAIGVLALHCRAAFAQTQPERFWLAGRYDWNRIVVYFDAVKFNGTIPSEAEKLPCPIEMGFFCPVKLPASYIAQFQNGPNAEHFALGDQYDLILDGNSIVTVTLTTLIGAESDEGVGNDSFIGALATLDSSRQDWLYFMKSYLVVRHHRESAEKQVKDQKKIRTNYAYLEDEPVRFDILKQIVGLLSDRMKTITTTDAQRHEVESLSPLLTVQQFHVADGSLRYYARAGWKPRKGTRSKLNYGGLGAWIALLPTLHIVAVESVTEFEYLPELLNVIDLGGGDTALIASQHGDDSAELNLVQYRDGLDLRHMPTLQSIGAGE